MQLPALFVQVILFSLYIGLFLSAYAGIQFRISLYSVIQLPKLLKKRNTDGAQNKITKSIISYCSFNFFFFFTFQD